MALMATIEASGSADQKSRRPRSAAWFKPEGSGSRPFPSRHSPFLPARTTRDRGRETIRAARETFEAFARFDEAMTERQAAWMERRGTGARVVRLRNAHHYLFITHAADVQREVAAFVKGLSPP